MEKSEINDIRTLLTRKNVELTSQLTKRDGIAVDHNPDALEAVQNASAREMATQNPERESKMLREVRTALTRIEHGSYGMCLNCDEEIGADRLRALPWTSLCIACQELDDRRTQRAIRAAGIPASAGGLNFILPFVLSFPSRSFPFPTPLPCLVTPHNTIGYRRPLPFLVGKNPSKS
jgi:DnaK suppressor protein